MQKHYFRRYTIYTDIRNPFSTVFWKSTQPSCFYCIHYSNVSSLSYIVCIVLYCVAVVLYYRIVVSLYCIVVSYCRIVVLYRCIVEMEILCVVAVENAIPGTECRSVKLK
jgi:hypothetical protein